MVGSRGMVSMQTVVGIVVKPNVGGGVGETTRWVRVLSPHVLSEHKHTHKTTHNNVNKQNGYTVGDFHCIG